MPAPDSTPAPLDGGRVLSAGHTLPGLYCIPGLADLGADVTRIGRITPERPGVPVADGLAGMSAALNVLAALQARQRDGRGRFLDVAIVDGPLFLASMELEHWWATGRSRTRGDTHLTGGRPWYGVFETADG